MSQNGRRKSKRDRQDNRTPHAPVQCEVCGKLHMNATQAGLCRVKKKQQK
jgi:hypothetical protein